MGRSIHDDNTYWRTDRILTSNKFNTYITITDEQVVGYMDETHGYEKNEIYVLYVKNAYRNRGFETALLQGVCTTDLMVLADANEIPTYDAAGIYSSAGVRDKAVSMQLYTLKQEGIHITGLYEMNRHIVMQGFRQPYSHITHTRFFDIEMTNG